MAIALATLFPGLCRKTGGVRRGFSADTQSICDFLCASTPATPMFFSSSVVLSSNASCRNSNHIDHVASTVYAALLAQLAVCPASEVFSQQACSSCLTVWKPTIHTSFLRSSAEFESEYKYTHRSRKCNKTNKPFPHGTPRKTITESDHLQAFAFTVTETTLAQIQSNLPSVPLGSVTAAKTRTDSAHVVSWQKTTFPTSIPKNMLPGTVSTPGCMDQSQSNASHTSSAQSQGSHAHSLATRRPRANDATLHRLIDPTPTTGGVRGSLKAKAGFPKPVGILPENSKRPPVSLGGCKVPPRLRNNSGYQVGLHRNKVGRDMMRYSEQTATFSHAAPRQAEMLPLKTRLQ